MSAVHRTVKLCIGILSPTTVGARTLAPDAQAQPVSWAHAGKRDDRTGLNLLARLGHGAARENVNRARFSAGRAGADERAAAGVDRADVRGAERTGQLRPGDRVVEYTGGSTGSSLAMVCAAKGYRGHFVSSDAFAEEKLQTMRSFGSVVELIPSVNRKVTPELVQAGLTRVRELLAVPGTYWTDQFNNPDNPAGYRPMAEEILRDLRTLGYIGGDADAAP